MQRYLLKKISFSIDFSEETKDKIAIPNYFCIALSAYLELLTESDYLKLQKTSNLHKSVKYLSISIVFKTIYSVGLIFLLSGGQSSPNHSGMVANEKFQILALSSGFIVGSFVYFIFMKVFTYKTMHDVCKNADDKHPEILIQTYSRNCTTNYHLSKEKIFFIMQCFLKQFLTQAENYFMTFTAALTLSEQGVFNVITSLAALPARFLFQPIEEGLFQYFSKTNDNQKNLKILSILIKYLFNFTILLAVFGNLYAENALEIYAKSDKLNSGTSLLKILCFYQIFIAINGVTEAFIIAKMSEKQVLRVESM